MAYKKTEWINNETALSADNMNHIEDGISNIDNKIDTVKDNAVPYTGATKDVNLGTHSATVNNFVANGTTKLGGGFEPIHTYAVGATTLYVYSEVYDPSNGYTFIGKVADEDGYNTLVYGSYALSEEGNQFIGFYTLDISDTGTVAMKQYYESGGHEIYELITETKLANSLNDIQLNLDNLNINFSTLQNEVDEVKSEVNEVKKQLNDGWEFLDLIAEKTFSKAFTEVKPGKSGIPNGNATVDVTTTTWQKKIEGVVVGYKTIVDVTCMCEQFNLKDVGFNVLLSKVGSRWFMPRMAVSRGNIQSAKFTKMMDRLNAQKDRVGILVDEVSVFRDATTNLGALNVSGVINGQVTYDYAEFRVFAVMLELDKDNEGKSIPCTGAHYRIVLYHPETIL